MKNISKAIKSELIMNKHKEMRSLLIKVPNTLLNNKDEQIISMLKSINNLPSIDKQIEILHNIFKCTTIGEEDKYEILVLIYFDIFIKHPVKSVICKLFNNSTKTDEQLVVKILSVNIQRLLTNYVDSLEDLNLQISELNECLQFKLALEAICLNDKEVLALAKRAIVKYHDEFKASLSPALKNEISAYLHQVVQLVISCIKYFLLLSENNDNIQLLIKMYLNDIERIAVELLINPDIPIDSKSNLGILILSKSKLTYDNTPYDMIKDNAEEPVKRMCLIIGFICTMDVKNLEFSKIYEVTNTTINNILKNNAMDPAINLAVSRCFLQITKKLLLSKLKPENVPEPEIAAHLLSTANIVLDFSISNVEHFMDSCKRFAKDCLKNLCEFSVKYEWHQLMDSIFEHILSTPSSNLNTLLISTISSNLTYSEISAKIPDVKQMLLRSIESSNSSVNQNVLNSYETLMYNDKKIGHSLKMVTDEEWNLNWIEPVIHEIIYQQKNKKKKIVLENILKKCVKTEPSIVSSILKYKKELDSGFVLLCLGAAKKNGHASQDEIIIYDEILQLILLADDVIKLSALALVGESQKITEPFSSRDFECIIMFLEYNVNVQNPSVRQQILGIFKKIFERIEKSLGVLFRKKEDETIVQYFTFLEQLHVFCLENLFPGANFTRKTLSLKLLSYTVNILQQNFSKQLESLWDQQKWDLLETNLEADTYETNKEITIDVMKLIPQNIILKLSKLNIDATKDLIKNIKPNASISASYQLEFIARFLPSVVKTQFAVDKWPIIEPEFYAVIKWCEKLLSEALNCAENSLAKAASVNPIYGVILCIRHLFSKIDLNQISTCNLWYQLHDSVIELCSRASAAVSAALICSAPEGFSMDTEDDQEVLTNAACYEATPQMILLCAWRTVKEVSLILGDVCLKAPIKSEISMVGLITQDQIFSIGDRFVLLLSQLKHRGAFEQAFVGFSKFCERVYSAKEKELHQLPHNMLEQLLVSISNEENDKDELCIMNSLCSTRRSAGLPFMIQALLTAELKIGSSIGLHYCMKHLIKLCRNGKSLESRTHSLNILRALFRCTELSESLAEYVSDGLICAILGFSQDSFIERNASTLLFAALITRIFGVERSKYSQNKLTGKVFFTRYPQLFDFIIDKFQDAMHFIWREGINGKPTNVVSILLFLLSRLYPSQNEACDSNFKLAKIVPLVSIFSASSDLKTRTLSAKFIAVAIRPIEFFDRIQQITLKLLNENTNFSSNSIHGSILQILFLIRSISIDTNFFDFDQTNLLLGQLTHLSKVYGQKSVLISAIIEVVLEVLARCFNDLDKSSATYNKHLSKFIMDLNYTKNPVKNEMIMMNESNIVLLNFIKTKFDETASSPLIQLNRDMFGLSYNHQQAALNLLLLVLDFEKAAEMAGEYNIKPLEMHFAKHLFRNEDLKCMRLNLQSDESLMAQLNSFTRERSFYDTTVKSFEILCLLLQPSNYQYEAAEISEMVQDAMGQPDGLKLVMFKYISICLSNCLDFESVSYTFLLELSTGGSTTLKGAMMSIIRFLINKLPNLSSFDIVSDLSRSVFNVLMNDEQEIRYDMSLIISRLHSAKVGETKNEHVVPIYAQHLYLNLLINQLNSEFFDVMDQIALLLGIFLLENENPDDYNNAAEYRVFDKNEANIFREEHIIRQDCLRAIKKIMMTQNIEAENSLQVIHNLVSMKYKQKASEKIRNYLTTNFVSDLNSIVAVKT